MPELAPLGFIVGSWYKQKITLETFEDMYKTYLRTKSEQIKKLAEREQKKYQHLCVRNKNQQTATEDY